MITIYLADLTHCTITTSNDAFPLNIGLVGAYAIKCFPEVNIELFKYPYDLKSAIDRNLPNILGCSNYPWNLDLGISFFKYVKKLDKKVITVMGGPNISYDAPEQYKMLYNLKHILDFYTLYEGESAFMRLLEKGFANDFDIAKMKRESIDGCLALAGNSLQEGKLIERESNLSKFPSPYLTGLLDKFFDDRLSPMIETHRGCAFSCTYCHEGHKSYNKVHRYELSRIYNEIEYISARVGNKVTNLMITDPNFGLFNEDTNIAKKIKEVYNRTNYPKTIFASTSKNRKNNLIRISKILKPISMPIWLSVQSLTVTVLEKIKRKNINIDDLISVQQELKKNNVMSNSELIMCLPSETFQTHIESLAQLIKLQTDQIACYQLMLLRGSELASDEGARKANSFTCKFRILPRSFSDIENVGRSMEIEEIVVATKDFSFEDYLRARQLHLLIFTYYNCKAFRGFFKLLMEYGLDIKTFIFNLLDLFMAGPETKAVLNHFVAETKSELFDSEKELKEYYRKDENFNKLVMGTFGTNLIFNHVAQLYMEKSMFLFAPITNATMLFLPKDQVFQAKINNIMKFCRRSFENCLSPDRKKILTSEYFKYNIAEWLDSNQSLDSFYNDLPAEVIFHTPEEQFDFVESYFERYGRNSQAFGKILSRFGIGDMLRKANKMADSAV